MLSIARFGPRLTLLFTVTISKLKVRVCRNKCPEPLLQTAAQKSPSLHHLVSPNCDCFAAISPVRNMWSPTAGSGGASSIPTSNRAAYLRSLSHSQELGTWKFSSSFARSSATSLDDFSDHLDLDCEMEESTSTAVICHDEDDRDVLE